MKSFAQVFDQLSLRDSVLIIRRYDDPKRELKLVSSSLGERIIRFYHDGPGGAHQASKATSAKPIRCFWWPDFKRDVRCYIACCSTCEKFIRLARTPRAGLISMSVGGRSDSIAIDIVGGKDSLPLTPREHKYILSIIDYFTRYAIAVPLSDQLPAVVISAIIGNYTTGFRTPRRILPDRVRNFESSEFSYFCNLSHLQNSKISIPSQVERHLRTI